MSGRLGEQSRLRTARRVFGLIPVLVFLLTFILFVQRFNTADAQNNTPVPMYLFTDVLLRALAASLASIVLCIGAYNFYRYLLERSPGL